MNRLTNNLLEKNISLTDEIQKAKILKSINYIALLALILYSSYIIIFNKHESNFLSRIYLILGFLAVSIVDLILIYKKKVFMAGNILLSAWTMVELFSLFQRLGTDIDFFTFYAGGYYYLLLFLAGSAFFSTKLNFHFNALLIFISTIILYFLSQKMLSVDILPKIRLAFFNFELTVAIVYFILWQFRKNVEKSFSKVENNTQQLLNKNNELQKLSLNIKNSAINLVTKSNLVGQLSTTLAKDSNEQNSTTEEISSSMEEMLATIEQNSDIAISTNQKIKKSVSELEIGGKTIISTLDLVSTISDKIHIISDIAGKTDILAINAAIEAARASQNGSGFAVIAEEIRKLAEKSNTSASEIVQLADNGKKMSVKSSQVVISNSNEIKNIVNLVNDIVKAGEEQASNAMAITNAIKQLSDISSRYSGSANQMEKLSSELLEQADGLKSLIN